MVGILKTSTFILMNDIIRSIEIRHIFSSPILALLDTRATLTS